MFVYIQSLLIMMLEILCCKIFFEAFGIKREENNCWKNYSIVIGLTVLCYFIAMIFRDYFIVKQVFSIILITFFMAGCIHLCCYIYNRRIGRYILSNAISLSPNDYR